MAPGSTRNTPPNGQALKITLDIVERNDRRVLVYTDNGQSVAVQKLDNLLCFGHKGKTCRVRAINTTALAAISYLFFRQNNGSTFVMAYGQDPKDVVLGDLTDPDDHSLGIEMAAQYGSAVARSIGYFTKDQYRAKKHGAVAPLYANLEELMMRARDVPTPGPRQGCELGAFIRPALQEKDVEICVQNLLVDRYGNEPWCKALKHRGVIYNGQDSVIKTDVLTIPSPSLGDIHIQILFWPRTSESKEPEFVDDAVIPGLRIFQSSDRAVTLEDKFPEVFNTGKRGEKDVNWWLCLNHDIIYVMVPRDMLHQKKMLDTKDGLHDNEVEAADSLAEALGRDTEDITHLALTLGSEPLLIKRKRKKPERLVDTVPQRELLPPRKRANQQRNHRQQAEPDINAAIKMLEKSAAQTQKLKNLLKGLRNVPTPDKKRELVGKNQELAQTAKSAHALVAKISQG
eukprot:gene27454-4756_t